MKQFEFDPEHTFFTSDTHFGHANIINLCKRPFRDVNHMNDMLVENWNNVVTDDDTVFHWEILLLVVVMYGIKSCLV